MNEIEKWFWKASFCKAHQLPPHQQWAWDEAEAAYTKHLLSKI